MYPIPTLYALRQHLGMAATETGDDNRLFAMLLAASAYVERAAGRHFVPRRATIAHTAWDSQELLLDEDLLELLTLTNGDGSSITLGDVIHLPARGVIAALRLTGGNAFTWQTSPFNAITVTGIWGWHEDWDSAWRDSADTVADNPLTASAVTVTVSDADGIDEAGLAPRFQAGQMLRIEEEYLRVLVVDATANTLAVQRGVNGTTAAGHIQGTPITVYQPSADVALLTLRYAAWLYKEPDTGSLRAAPEDMTAALAALQRLRIKSSTA
ncbi:MAG: hypothetical protein K8I60_04485 [Anaerolineae bacterium]|nr:hypothetical protein [Anaerolineae bacterium]